MIEYRLLYKFLFGERLHMNAILNLICNLIDIFARNLPFKEAVVFVPEFVKERGFLATLFEEDFVEEVKIIYFLWILSSSFPPELAGTENRLKVQRHMPSGCWTRGLLEGSGWSGCRNFPDPPECGGWWPGFIQQVAGLGRLPSSGFGCLKLAVPSRNLSPRYLTSFQRCSNFEPGFLHEFIVADTEGLFRSLLEIGFLV